MSESKDDQRWKVTLDTSMSDSGQSEPKLNRETISQMRKSYGEKGLVESELPADPIALFTTWLGQATSNPLIVEPNAMVLSTLHEGAPVSRTVLLKDVSTSGFTFFTNYQSRKGIDIATDHRVSLLFPWYPMERQVIVVGTSERIDGGESDSYFATRPWSSQIGAWASNQSQPLESRELLEDRWREYATKYPEGSRVPRPPHWGGFLVTPSSIEFWQGRYSRLHDRIRFESADSHWEIHRIFP